MLKQTVLDRYEQTTDGKRVIDVAAQQVEALYNNYDRNAPYIRRDLDQELVEYLIEAAQEIHPEPFVIQFTLTQPPDESQQSRILGSINAYFLYLIEIEQRKLVGMFHRSAILFCIGAFILFFAISANQTLDKDSSVLAQVFAEGLTIAAWVSLWEALAVFLIEWFPHHKKIRLYQKLAHAAVSFKGEGASVTRS